jgi:RecA-family ATPase
MEENAQKLETKRSSQNGELWSKRLSENNEWVYITESDLHPHLKIRMIQRGISPQEIEDTLNRGWESFDAKPGTFGKTMVYLYQDE